MNPEDEINRRANRISKKDVGDSIKNDEKSKRMAQENSFLRQYWKDIKTSYALQKDFYTGPYTRIPFRMVASIAAALVYMASLLDVVPDWIPFAGLLDDALVLATIFAASCKDLDAYLVWTHCS